MWHSSPSPKYGAHVGRALVGFGQQHAAGRVLIEVRADGADDGVGFGQVLAVRAFALDQIRHGVQPEAVHAHIEPEVHDLSISRTTAGLS